MTYIRYLVFIIFFVIPTSCSKEKKEISIIKETNQNMEKGVIVMVTSDNEKNPLRYIYPPHLKMNHKEAKQWGKDQKTLLKKTDPDKNRF